MEAGGETVLGGDRGRACREGRRVGGGEGWGSGRWGGGGYFGREVEAREGCVLEATPAIVTPVGGSSEPPGSSHHRSAQSAQYDVWAAC